MQTMTTAPGRRQAVPAAPPLPAPAPASPLAPRRTSSTGQRPAPIAGLLKPGKVSC